MRHKIERVEETVSSRGGGEAIKVNKEFHSNASLDATRAVYLLDL
jgi:hypothetical protein